jgi:hypothetical protein
MQDVVSVPHEKTKKQKNPKQSKIHVGCVVCLFHRKPKEILCKSSRSLESFSSSFFLILKKGQIVAQEDFIARETHTEIKQKNWNGALILPKGFIRYDIK